MTSWACMLLCPLVSILVLRQIFKLHIYITTLTEIALPWTCFKQFCVFSSLPFHQFYFIYKERMSFLLKFSLLSVDSDIDAVYSTKQSASIHTLWNLHTSKNDGIPCMDTRVLNLVKNVVWFLQFSADRKQTNQKVWENDNRIKPNPNYKRISMVSRS